MDIIDQFFKSSTVYHIRVTHPDVTLDTTFDAYDNYKFVIVSQEGGTPETPLHQHILISKILKEGDTNENSDFKKDIKEILLKTYPEAKGNKGHSITLARNKKTLASYVLKDGQYKSRGFSDSWIKRAIALSFNQNDWKKKYKNLLDSVILKKITLEQYTKSLLELKAQANQPIYRNHIIAHVTAVGIRVGELDAQRMTDSIMERIYT